jgi:hypothetical protein
MSGAALDHPAVRDYLWALRRSIADLPEARAAELEEQITAHLDDALPPDADDERVYAVLRRLGPPADLAADELAAAALAAAAAKRLSDRRRLRRWLCAAVAAVAVIAGAITAYQVPVIGTAPLTFDGRSGWWFARDAARQVNVEADGARQTTVPARWQQRQGLAILVRNPGRWTQTVLGLAADSAGPGSGGISQLSVSTNDTGGDFRALRYARFVSIPPHQARWLRLMWTTIVCLERGGDEGTDELTLRVRVGWLTRAEHVSLGRGWFLSGPSPSHGRCPD